jgi:lipopolysaccharide export system permease protein
MLAFFAFVVYLNLINLGQSWVGSGRIGMAVYLVALHGGVLALTALWLAKRNNNWGRRGRGAVGPSTPGARP